MSDTATSPKRIFTLPVGGLAVDLPAFFPSISSLRAELPPIDYLALLLAVKHPLLLVSAYDLSFSTPHDQSALYAAMAGAHQRGTIILLDSGRYESTWTRASDWSAESLAAVLNVANCPLAFCYDDYPSQQTIEHLVTAIDLAVARDQAAASHATVLPILHGSPAMFPKLAHDVAAITYALMIAIPERELGEGLLQRATTINAIRQALNQTGHYFPIHLLGTSSPISILVYTIAGADSFDGLEWANTSIDHRTARQFHFHQAEILGDRSHPFSLSDAPYTEATLANNLLFFRIWLRTIREALVSDTISTLAARYLPRHFLSRLESICVPRSP